MSLLSLFHYRYVLKMLAFVVLQYHYEEIAVFGADFTLADKYVNHTASFFSLSSFFFFFFLLSREFHVYACLFVYKGRSNFIKLLALYSFCGVLSLSK
jgi:hypothetical protein